MLPLVMPQQINHRTIPGRMSDIKNSDIISGAGINRGTDFELGIVPLLHVQSVQHDVMEASH